MQAYKVRTPKYKFYVEKGGQPADPVIILIMGLGAQSLVWSNVFCKRLIDTGFQVVRFDNRDIGKSSKLKHKNKLTKLNSTRLKQLQLLIKFKLGITLAQSDLMVPYDLYDMAEDVNQLMHALDIERCHVLGMSMGGMIAQIMAANYAQHVISLGLLATSNNRLFLPPPSLLALHTLLRPPVDHTNTADLVDASVEMARVVGSPDYFDEHRIRSRSTKLLERRFYPKGVARQLMAVLATGSLHPLNQRIVKPTLIVHGTHDKLLPPAHARSLANSIAGAKLELISGLGHDIPYSLTRLIADRFARHFHDARPKNLVKT